MSSATRLPRPSRSTALLLVAAMVAVLVALVCRTTLSATTTTPSAQTTFATAVDLESTGEAVVETAADHAQRQLPRQPLAGPTGLLVAILAMAAVVATGLRYTISSVPDAGRATSGLRPPPPLRA